MIIVFCTRCDYHLIAVVLLRERFVGGRARGSRGESSRKVTVGTTKRSAARIWLAGQERARRLRRWPSRPAHECDYGPLTHRNSQLLELAVDPPHSGFAVGFNRRKAYAFLVGTT